MTEKVTRRCFLQRVVAGFGTVVVAGLAPTTSRAELLNQLAQHLTRTGYQILRYVKF